MSAEVLATLRDHGVVPVVRSDSDAFVRAAVPLLREAGFRTFEITLSVPGATGIIAELARDADLLPGAGTILSLEDARRCLDAGARYIVSPCVIEGLPELCHEAGAACMMTGLTANEVFTAHQLGSDAVKVFPAQSAGGAPHLRALRAVFPEIPLVPTGGVTADNLVDYLRAGAVCVGVGNALFPGTAAVEHDSAAVIRHARFYLETFQSYKDAT